REQLMDQCAITYPYATLSELSGTDIKAILEDIADNLFNPDPYLQQGGDMVRVAGLTYACNPSEKTGSRISDLWPGAGPLWADKRHRGGGGARVAEAASGTPIWELVERYLKAHKTIAPRTPNLPRLVGVEHNPGLA